VRGKVRERRKGGRVSERQSGREEREREGYVKLPK